MKQKRDSSVIKLTSMTAYNRQKLYAILRKQIEDEERKRRKQQAAAMSFARKLSF